MDFFPESYNNLLAPIMMFGGLAIAWFSDFRLQSLLQTRHPATTVKLYVCCFFTGSSTMFMGVALLFYQAGYLSRLLGLLS